MVFYVHVVIVAQQVGFPAKGAERALDLKAHWSVVTIMTYFNLLTQLLFLILLKSVIYSITSQNEVLNLKCTDHCFLSFVYTVGLHAQF